MSHPDRAGTRAIVGSLDIMMPFYGDPELFRRAVESVLAQTDPHWRLVIIDDVYPDTAPGAWAKALDDDRIEYLRNEKNLGVNGNFMRCVELSTAEFTTVMGCDDLLLPNYVGRVRRLVADFPAADYVQPGVQVMDATGQDTNPLVDRVKRHFRPDHKGPVSLYGEELASSLLRGNWTYFPSIAWRTTRLRHHGFRRDLEVVLDLALQLDIVASGGRLLLDDVPSFRYRRHAASVSSWTAQDGSRFTEERRFFLECSGRMRALGWKRAARVARLHLSSRLNALTRVPASARARDGHGLVVLLRHVAGFRPQLTEKSGKDLE